MIVDTTHTHQKPKFFRHFALALILLAALLLAARPAYAASAAAPQTSPPATQPAAPATGSAQPQGMDPSYAALAALLENNQARAQLIKQLRTLAAQDQGHAASDASSASPARATGARAQPASPPAAAGRASLAQKLTTGLERFTDELAGNLAGTAAAASALLHGQARLQDLGKWLPALASLGAAIAAVLIAYLILRIAAARGFARLDSWIMQGEKRSADRQASQAPEAGPAAASSAASAAGAHRHPAGLRRFASIAPGRKLLGVLAALVIDIAATVLAALVAYIAVLMLAEHTPGTSKFALQFLTAFVLVEVVKALSRGIFATRYPKLRLLPMSSPTAIYWNQWLTLLIALTGYGLLLVVPVADALFPPAVGRLLGFLIMLYVYVHAVRVIWKNRRAIRAGLVRQAEQSSAAVFGTLIRVLARTWHFIALAYFTALFVVSQTDQQQALSFMARATVQSLAAILLGLLASVAVSSLLARRIRLPDEWRKALPLLEDRLNAYVPALLKSIRLLILVLVALVVLDAWQAFNLMAWAHSDAGHAAIAMVFHVGIILVIAALAWTVLASLIEHRLGVSGGHRPSEREKTLLMLFRNAVAVLIATMTLLIVLSQIGINIGPLIAGAGVAGLAIGFGAQKLVQDVITGVFIQLENGMNQNDVVEVCGLFGTVEKITIRSVVIRTMDGGYHLIPFSTIDKLTNHTRGYGYHYGEYNIAHRESVDEAIEQLQNAFRELMRDPVLAPEILKDIDIPGVTSLTEKGFTIRVLIKTTPGNQWAVQRGFNRLVKQYFDAAGIEMPYPQTVVHFGRDRDGYASPADLRVVDSLREVAGITPAAGQTLAPRLDPRT